MRKMGQFSVRIFKNCGKEIFTAVLVLRIFCSKRCQQKEQKSYYRLNKRKQPSKINFKDVHNNDSYVSINSSTVGL